MYLFRWIVLTLAVSLSFAAKAQEPPPDKAKSTEERASGPAQTLALSLITYYQPRSRLIPSIGARFRSLVRNMPANLLKQPVLGED